MQKRNTYSKEFKKRVALAAIQGDKPIAQIAADFEVLPKQVREWKQQALESLDSTFSKKRGRKNSADQPEEPMLYEQIGRLKIENEFLKKKYDQLLDL